MAILVKTLGAVVFALFILAGLAWVQIWPEGDVNEWDANVVASFPHDPAAYTQGLAIYEGQLYEGT